MTTSAANFVSSIIFSENNELKPELLATVVSPLSPLHGLGYYALTAASRPSQIGTNILVQPKSNPDLMVFFIQQPLSSYEVHELFSTLLDHVTPLKYSALDLVLLSHISVFC